MQRKTVALGIACGLICAICVFAYTQAIEGEADAARQEALARYGGDQLEVCVATQDIAAGERANSTNTSAKLWLADLLPADAVTDFSQVEGRQASSTILAGEVISSRRFDETDSTIDIPSGKTALSLPAKDVQAVGGAVTCGSSVDIYASGSQTKLLAKDVVVLATSAASTSSGKSTVSWVTVAVPAEKVQELITASRETEIYLVLPAPEQESE